MGLSIILYGTEHPGNLGSIARVCANFNFQEIVLVNPKCKIDEQARTMAKRAQENLDGFRVEDESFLENIDTLVMTHGRECFSYNMKRSMITPRQLADRLSDIDLNNASVGIMFGPEGEGFPPEMLERADIVLSIPTSREYSSMNLAMSVAIVLYELSLLEGKEGKITEPFEPATKQHKDMMLKFVDELLQGWEFPSDKARDTVKMAWRRMVGRSFLTEREAFALLGFLKRCQGKR